MAPLKLETSSDESSDDSLDDMFVDGGVHIQDRNSAFYQESNLADEPGAKLWHLPLRPAMNKIARRERRLSRAITGDSAENVYAECLRLVERNWRCDAEDALPQEYHQNTPYSLAMLSALTTLSRATRQARLYGHSLLSRVCKEEIASIVKKEDQSSIVYRLTRTSDHVISRSPKVKVCEPTIKENIYGITLADVAKTALIMKEEDQESKKIAKAGGLKAKQASKLRRQTLSAAMGKNPNATPGTRSFASELADAMTTECGQDLVRRSIQKKARKDYKKALRQQTQIGLPAGVIVPTGPRAMREYCAVPGGLVPDNRRKIKVQDGRSAPITKRMEKGLQMEDVDNSKVMQKRVKLATSIAASKSIMMPAEKYDFSAMPALGGRVGTTVEESPAAVTEAMVMQITGQTYGEDVRR